jgi:hypothetical protein
MILNKFITNYFPEINLDTYNEYQYKRIFQSSQYTSFNELISWPPNTFLILYSIIEYTDKYRILVSPQEHLSWGINKNHICDGLAKDWTKYLDTQILNSEPLEYNNTLKSLLDNVFNQENFKKCIYELMNDNVFCESVFILIIAIDKLFSKNSINNSNAIISSFLIKRNVLNILNNKKEQQVTKSIPINLADNNPKYGIVARKYNTPQSGLTLNNLTQNLTFIKPSVKYTHNINKVNKNRYTKDNYNILVIPWPFEVNDGYFSPSENKHIHMDDYFGFFDYSPKNRFDMKYFLSFILSAIRRVRVIDLIVFPECALSEIQFNELKKKLFEIFGQNAPSLLSGVYSKEKNIGKNQALLGFIDDSLLGFNIITQEKHHRWFLDKNQLRNYNLAASLAPNKKWWENIEVGKRKLTTLETPNGVILCPLICEDLARQEPVAQAVRAIGPNLVVCLLLDGPQIAPRWPGKYAAVLADDPGSSVLSVTALGMTLRATGLGHEPSKDIALWSEPGKPSETLQVSSKSGALLIELELESTKMWSIDGRFEEKPVLKKKMHTTLELEFKNKTLNALQSTLEKMIKTGGNNA